VQAVLDPAGSEHQRVSDVDFEQMMRAIAGLPRQDGVLDPWLAPLLGWLDRLRASRVPRETQVALIGFRGGDGSVTQPGQR